MRELRAGDTKTFEIGGQSLVVGPIPFGRLKRIIRMVADVSKNFEAKEVQENLLNVVPKLVEDYVDEFIPLIFDAKSHPFINKEWIDDNLTIPAIKEIIVTAITVNALGDFFQRTVKAPAPLTVATEESGTTPTPSASSGSITSSDSPMAGDPVMSTT